MIGSKNPTAALVVAPRKAVTTLMFVKTSDSNIPTARMTMVQKTFLPAVKGVPETSSMESLVGRTQNGVANSTTIHIPNNEI